MMTEENIVYDYGPEKPKRDRKSKRGSWCDGPKDRVVGGAIMITIGMLFLLEALNIVSDFRWWTLFLIVPGIALLLKSWGTYMRTGMLVHEERKQAFGGVMSLSLGLIFLFGISWSYIWPMFLIIPGFALLMGWIGDDK